MKLPAGFPVLDADLIAALYAALGDLGASAGGDAGALARLPRSAEERLALACEASRFDPRLLGVVVDLVGRSWRAFDPVRLRAALRAIPSPATFGVVAEFALHLPQDEDRAGFLSFLTLGLRPAAPQLFFVGLYAPGGRLMRAAADRARSEYERWGYLAREVPYPKDSPRRRLRGYSPRVRRTILHGLLSTGRPVRMAEYLDSVERTITRQQALVDLCAVPGLLRRGHGRGARFRLG